jgi:mannose-1-phosphate guanylyltransferase
MGRRTINLPNFEYRMKRGRSERFGHHWGVILAGGDGERLLPLTRWITGDDRPKQFCRVLGNETLLLQTRTRVSRMIPLRQTLVLVTKTHERFYSEQLNDAPPSCLLVQPNNRGTAPAILYSLMHLRQLDPDGVVAFFPSDHYFLEEASLDTHLDSAFLVAESHDNVVVLLGMVPEGPEVDYGWIEPSAYLPNAGARSIFRVARFWEKPPESLASSLMNLGCLWNSFIMIGRVQAFLDLSRRALPALCRLFGGIRSRVTLSDAQALCRLYSEIPAINYSQSVLATCPEGLAVIRAGGLGWSDLGEPGRVLSVIARNRIKTQWNFETVANSMAIGTAVRMVIAVGQHRIEWV